VADVDFNASDFRSGRNIDERRGRGIERMVLR
jgi:hypothetical protein